MYLLKFVSRVGVDFEFVYVCPIKFRGVCYAWWQWVSVQKTVFEKMYCK